MDLIGDTRTNIRAGDPSEGLYKHDTLGGPPYCFRLNVDHDDGAHAAIAAYKPWWKDLKRQWNPEIEQHRKSFERWTLQKEAKKDIKPTHVTMNKGNFFIEAGPNEDDFLERYAKCILSGHKMYFVERLDYSWPIGCCRLYMDLDFKQIQGISERGIEASANVCSKTVARFFPGITSNCIVCSTTYKDEEKNDSSGNKVKRVKTGVHLYWPNYYVTSLQALHIRESIISDLTEAFGLRMEPSMNEWEDVVDSSVYNKANGSGGGGLRMVGSCKCSNCKACKGRKKSGSVCEVCNDYGSVDDLDSKGRPGRPYVMLCVLGPDNQRCLDIEAFYLGNYHQLILDTKIRTTLQEATLNCNFTIPAGAPLYIAEVQCKKRKSSGTKGERQLDSSDPVHVELQKCIRSSFGTLYESVVLRKTTKGPKQYTVNVTGLNCRFCQNIGREHNNQNIYFAISREGIVQRCYDNASVITEEMRFGLCSEYSSSKIPLDPLLSQKLWPDDSFAKSPIGTTSFCAADQPTGIPFALKCLLNAGEYLSTKLFSSSWTSTLGLHTSKQRKGLKDFIPQDPRDLGSKGIQAYKSLGLAWADELCTRFMPEQAAYEANRQSKFQVSILKLEQDLLDIFSTIVLCTTSTQDPSFYDNCVVIDDFMFHNDLNSANV